jgi:hypothetical protein
MWEPQHLITLCASMACYGDSFTFYLPYSIILSFWFNFILILQCETCNSLLVGNVPEDGKILDKVCWGIKYFIKKSDKLYEMGLIEICEC